MQPAGEAPAATSMSHQLEHCLAVTVLEVLTPQAMAMHPQQQLTLGACDQRDLLGGVKRTAHGCAAPRYRCLCR